MGVLNEGTDSLRRFEVDIACFDASGMFPRTNRPAERVRGIQRPKGTKRTRHRGGRGRDRCEGSKRSGAPALWTRRRKPRPNALPTSSRDQAVTWVREWRNWAVSKSDNEGDSALNQPHAGEPDMVNAVCDARKDCVRVVSSS